MKKIRFLPLLTALCLMLSGLSGCAKKDDSKEQELLDRIEKLEMQLEKEKNETTAAAPAGEPVPAAAEAATEAAAVTTAETTVITAAEAPKAELPDVSVGTYLNGEIPMYYEPGYIYGAEGGFEGMATSILVSESLTVMAFANLEVNNCVPGTELSIKDLNDKNDIGLYFTDSTDVFSPSMEAYSAVNNPDMFSEAVVRIYEYEPKQYIGYYIKVRATVNGKTYDIETAEIAEYDDSVENDPCFRCHGTTVCPKCNGTGGYYTNVGNIGWINCAYCEGTGACKYCEKGKEVYMEVLRRKVNGY